MAAYDPAADPVHGSGWNSAERWGGWVWRDPSRGEHFRRCSFCGCIHPEDLAAETAGGGICRVCGKQGWEACFRTQPLGVPRQAIDQLLADPAIPESEKQQLRGEHPAHSYDPGGWYASWADRKYGWPHKFYVDVPNRDPGALFCIGSSSEAREGPYAPGGECYRPLADRYPGQEWVAASDLTPEQSAIIERDRSGAADYYLFGTHPSHHAKFYSIHLADPRLSPDVKDAIERVSGLRFTFTGDGKVGWQRWEAAK